MAEMTFGDMLDEVERRVKRDLTSEEMAIVQRMREAGKTVDQIVDMLNTDSVKSIDARTYRYEVTGTGTVIDITDVVIPQD